MMKIKNSLKNHLTITIVALLLLTGLVNTVINFFDVMHETLALQDKTLKQVASYIDPKTPFNHHLTELQHTDLYIQTSASLNNHSDLWVGKVEGFYDLVKDDKPYRYYLKLNGDGYVMVMQDNAYRTDLALDVALDNTIPFLLLIPLLTLAIVFLIRYKLKPVEQLANEIQHRQDLDLRLIEAQNIPDEIDGFIVSINKLLGRTNQLIQQQQRFIADAAHELRTPMTAMSLQMENLLQQPLSDELHQKITQLNQSIKRQRHLIEQLLSLARSQATRVEPQFQQLSSQKIIQQVINDLLHLFQSKQQDVGNVSEQDIQFYGNEIEFYTLLKTLLDNAMTYTVSGSQIDVGCRHTDKQIIFG